MTSISLAKSKYIPCNSETPRIEGAEAEELKSQLDTNWQLDADHLKRLWKTADFVSAFNIATTIALLAQAADHHPDLEVGWGRVSCDLTTHANKGLSLNDFILAARIDKALA